MFIDYGPEWEEAWNKYEKEWSASPDSDNYVPASMLRNDLSIPLRTAAEQLSEPYPDNIAFYCHYDYAPGVWEGPWVWENEWAQLPMIPCRIISREAGDANADEEAYYYTTVMLDEDELDGTGTAYNMEYAIPSGENHILADVPRWAIEIRDKLYSKDEFIQNSFRHEMMMPDEIFPETWKNLHTSASTRNQEGIEIRWPV